jgi:hypothetical protein
MNNLIKKLLNYSINIQIKPEKNFSDLASLKTVISVLSNLRNSFRNFLKIEFIKQEKFRSIHDKDEEKLDKLIKEMELLIVDSKIGSYQTSIAPNLEDINYSLFDNDLLDWKKDKYNTYRNKIIFADFNDDHFIEEISKKYTPHERKNIFNPIFNAIADGKDYKINLLDSDREKIVRTLQPLSENIILQITPHIEKAQELKEKNYIAYLRLSTKGDKVELKKTNIKKIYDIEELMHDTFPLKTDTIKHEQSVFVLKEKITCEVIFSDNLYYIKFEPLEIDVWGQTREEAQEAFNFTFHSLYENFVLEKDKNLSPKAQSLKLKIMDMIKTIHNET